MLESGSKRDFAIVTLLVYAGLRRSECVNLKLDQVDLIAKEIRVIGKGDKQRLATVYKGNIIKNLIMDCQSYTKYRPNETTGGIFVSWRRKEELPTGA